MNEHSRDALNAHYAEAASWNRDRVQTMNSARRIAFWVAGVAAAIALLEAIALVLLTPLKTVEPYTLMVDRTTGYAQALKPLEQEVITPDAALTQSFLVQYVIARESFDIAAVNTNYRKVGLFSAGSARSGYLQLMQASNPSSPLVVYPRTSLIEVHVKSVSPIGKNAALIRFETVRTDAGGPMQPGIPWVAVIRYQYSREPMKLADRFVNPLGFQVVGYRKDPEALPPAPASLPNVSAPSASLTPVPSGGYYSQGSKQSPPGAAR